MPSEPEPLPTLWLLEDSALEAQAVRQALGQVATVEHFSDGAGLLEALVQRPAPDLLVLDWNLPGMSGLEVCQHLRGQRATEALPILLLTVNNRVEDLVQGLEMGANDFVTKPFEPVELEARVRALLRSGAVRRRLLRDEQARRRLAEGALTEVRHAEEAARLSKLRLQLAMQATRDVIWEWDVATGVLTWSPAFESVFGYPPGDVEPTLDWWYERVHPEESERVAGGLNVALATGVESWHDEYRFRRGDGTYAHVLARAFIVRGPEGRAVQLVGAMQDVSARLATEHELRRTRELLAGVLEQMPMGVLVAEAPTGRVFMSNRKVSELLRHPYVPPESISGYSAEPAFHLDGRPVAPEEWPLARAVLRGEQVEAEEFFVERGDGTRGRLRLSSAPVRDAQGHIQAGVVMLADVTAERELEATLREREERMRGLLESTSEGIWGVDGEGRCIFANPACVRLLGYDSADELLGRDMHALAHHTRVGAEAAPSPEECPLHAAFRVGQEVAVEDEVLWRKDGRPLPVRLRASPLLREGRVLGAVVAFEDVTERKAAELERERLVRVVEQASDFIGIADPEGRALYLNEAGRRMVGLPDLATVLRTRVLDYFREEDKPFVEEVILPTQAREGRWVGEYRFRHFQTGAGVPVHYTQFLLREPATGTVLGVAAIARDFTDELQRRSREAERVDFEQKLIGIVSHDLRNPLNAILLGAHALLRDDSLGPRQMRGLVRIQSSAERAVRMIRDLLDFTQARHGGGLPMNPQHVDLHALARQVVDEVQVAHPERTIEVVREGEGTVRGDPDRLTQVLSNLLSNALTYSPDETPVGVTTRGEAAHLVLEVHNAGTPIAPEVLPRIFEPMQRASALMDKQARSVGLGLYIVRHVVEAHGGSISVRSTAEHGTTFTVRLPRSGRGDADYGPRA